MNPPPAFLQKYLAWRHDLQTRLGLSSRVYPLLHRWRRSTRKQNLVGPATELCIEAPGGSGNSFFVRGFQMINPLVRVAHHHHVACQVKKSVELQLPTLVILRNPSACVVSRSYSAPWMIRAAFKQWIRFFRVVEQHLDSLMIVTFEDLTQEPGAVIDRLNTRFERTFVSAFPPQGRVLEHMDRGHASIVGRDPDRHRNPNLPFAEKKPLQEAIRPRVLAHPLAEPSQQLYEMLLNYASRG